MPGQGERGGPPREERLEAALAEWFAARASGETLDRCGWRRSSLIAGAHGIESPLPIKEAPSMFRELDWQNCQY